MSTEEEKTKNDNSMHKAGGHQATIIFLKQLFLFFSFFCFSTLRHIGRMFAATIRMDQPFHYRHWDHQSLPYVQVDPDSQVVQPV